MNLGNGLAYVGNNPVNRLDPYGTLGIDVEKLKIIAKENKEPLKKLESLAKGELKRVAEPLILDVKDWFLTDPLGQALIVTTIQVVLAYSSDNVCRVVFQRAFLIGEFATLTVGADLDLGNWAVGRRTIRVEQATLALSFRF
jgi:hypothetical protein